VLFVRPNWIFPREFSFRCPQEGRHEGAGDSSPSLNHLGKRISILSQLDIAQISEIDLVTNAWKWVTIDAFPAGISYLRA